MLADAFQVQRSTEAGRITDSPKMGLQLLSGCGGNGCPYAAPPGDLHPLGWFEVVPGQGMGLQEIFFLPFCLSHVLRSFLGVTWPFLPTANTCKIHLDRVLSHLVESVLLPINLDQVTLRVPPSLLFCESMILVSVITTEAYARCCK